MDTIFTTDYYTQGIWIILGGIIALYIALNILWNKKLVPARRQKGVATPYFGNMFKRITQFSFKEDPRNIAPKKAPKIVKKLLTLKTINWFLLALTFLLIGIANVNAWVPFLLLVIVVAVQSSGPLKARDRILSRMFAVASSAFRYGKGADLNPWGYVQIKKWEDLTVPGETRVTFPANWDASSIGARDGFEAHFNTTVTEKNSWIYEWKTVDGYVLAHPINHLPDMANYPGSEKHPWHVIPLGVGTQGEVTVDLTATPHMLICGTTGSGKSVLQRNLIFHCIQHNDMFRFLGVDVKRVELKPFARYAETVLGIGTNLEDGVEIVRYAKEVMETRYQEMEDRGVNHFKDMIDENGKPPYAIMLMVDEAYMFMATEGAKTDEGKMRDQLHGDAGVMLGEIARLGRAAGIHLVLATQRPDATVIRGELKANLDIRIAAGRLDATPSSMVLDSGAATQLPGHIKGRGIVRFGGHQEQFQGYFAPQSWIEEWLEAHPGVEPSIFPAGGKKADRSADEELEELAAQYDFNDEAIEIDGEMVQDTQTEEEFQEQLEELETPLDVLENTPENPQAEQVSAPPVEVIKTPEPVIPNEDDETLEYLRRFGLVDEPEITVSDFKSTQQPSPVSTQTVEEIVSEAPQSTPQATDSKLPSLPTIPSLPNFAPKPQTQVNSVIAPPKTLGAAKPTGLPSLPNLPSLPPMPGKK